MSEPKKVDPNTEIVIALVTPTGVEKSTFKKLLTAELKLYNYQTKYIRMADLLEPVNCPNSLYSGEYLRIYQLMTAGNNIRKIDSALLAKTAIAKIHQSRLTSEVPQNGEKVGRIVYLIDSLKHHDEERLFRHIYGDGFYLLGLNSPIEVRRANLLSKKGSMSFPKILVRGCPNSLT